MVQDRNRPRIGHPFDLSPRWCWLSWSIIAFGVGMMALAFWLEEEATAVADCIPIAALPGLAAIIFWFNHCVFKAVMSCPEDLETPSVHYISLDKKD